MTKTSNVIEQFLREMNSKPGQENGIRYGTVEELRLFAIRKGYLKKENRIRKAEKTSD